MNNDANTIKAGLRIVMGLLIFLMIGNTINLVNGVVAGNTIPAFFWFAVSTALCWNIYIGRLWARLLLIALLLFRGVPTLIIALGIGSGDSGFGIFIGLIGVVQIAMALALLLLRPVNAYFEYVAAQIL